MPALPGRKVPSFHDTDMEILLLLYFRVLTIALVALFAVITMRENRGQLFLRDPGGRQGDRPLLCQATSVLPQGGISCSRKGQEGKRKKKENLVRQPRTKKLLTNGCSGQCCPELKNTGFTLWWVGKGHAHFAKDFSAEARLSPALPAPTLKPCTSSLSPPLRSYFGSFTPTGKEDGAVRLQSFSPEYFPAG